MRPVTPRFTAAVARSHEVAFACDVLRAGAVINTSTVEVVSGRVTLDRRAQIRGRCDVTLGGAWAPLLATDPVVPFGSELRLARGIQYPPTTTETETFEGSLFGQGDFGVGLFGVGEAIEGTTALVAGDRELAGVGVYRIEDVDVDDSAGALTVRISGRDRSAAVSDAKFTAPYAIAAGTNYVDAIMAMVNAGVAGLQWSSTATGHTTPPLVHPEGGDRWNAAVAMAGSIGYEIFFDGTGVAVLRPEPDPSAAPVLEVAEGRGGVLVSARRRWTRQGGHNAVIATGENTGNAAPVRGEAYDLDPASPRYWHGPYGQVPRFWSSPLLATDDQAAAAARSMLIRQFGVSEQVSFTAVPNPALEPGDSVLVRRGRLGVDRVHVIDQIEIPLDVTSPIAAITRSRQVA